MKTMNSAIANEMMRLEKCLTDSYKRHRNKISKERVNRFIGCMHILRHLDMDNEFEEERKRLFKLVADMAKNSQIGGKLYGHLITNALF